MCSSRDISTERGIHVGRQSCHSSQIHPELGRGARWSRDPNQHGICTTRKDHVAHLRESEPIFVSVDAVSDLMPVRDEEPELEQEPERTIPDTLLPEAVLT